jgi:hypothetical protein
VTFTRHFHHIPGTTIEDQEGVRTPARPIACGGPGKCIQCTTDELEAFKRPPKFYSKDST